MAALAADRNTPLKGAELLNVPVATATTIYAGSIVVSNASGYAAPGSTATGLAFLGRAEESVINAGANAAKSINVRAHQMFYWANSATDAVVQADLGRTCYIEDDQTVCHTATDKSAIGVVKGLDSGGVWVFNG